MTTKSPELSVIIPIYNELGVIEAPLSELIKGFKGMPLKVEVLIIDDGSTDGWEPKIEEDWVRLIRHPINMGNGAAIKTGIRNSNAEQCLVMDGDGQHQFKDVQKLLDGLKNYSLVVGARDFNSSGTTHRNFANQMYSRLASYVADFKIQDLTSGMRAFKKKPIMEIIHLFPNRFSCPTTMTLGMIKLGYPVKYEPIEVLAREGKSKIKLVQDGINFLLIIMKITTLFSPLKIFIPVALLVGLIGLLTYLYVLIVAHRFSQWSVVLLTNAVTIFMIGLVAEEISQLKFKGTHRDDSDD
jgi:glycosyltransferase involved in cell wall biosynthesis